MNQDLSLSEITDLVDRFQERDGGARKNIITNHVMESVAPHGSHMPQLLPTDTQWAEDLSGSVPHSPIDFDELERLMSISRQQAPFHTTTTATTPNAEDDSGMYGATDSPFDYESVSTTATDISTLHTASTPSTPLCTPNKPAQCTIAKPKQKRTVSSRNKPIGTDGDANDLDSYLLQQDPQILSINLLDLLHEQRNRKPEKRSLRKRPKKKSHNPAGTQKYGVSTRVASAWVDSFLRDGNNVEAGPASQASTIPSGIQATLAGPHLGKQPQPSAQRVTPAAALMPHSSTAQSDVHMTAPTWKTFTYSDWTQRGAGGGTHTGVSTAMDTHSTLTSAESTVLMNMGLPITGQSPYDEPVQQLQQQQPHISPTDSHPTTPTEPFQRLNLHSPVLPRFTRKRKNRVPTNAALPLHIRYPQLYSETQTDPKTIFRS